MVKITIRHWILIGIAVLISFSVYNYLLIYTSLTTTLKRMHLPLRELVNTKDWQWNLEAEPEEPTEIQQPSNGDDADLKQKAFLEFLQEDVEQVDDMVLELRQEERDKAAGQSKTLALLNGEQRTPQGDIVQELAKEVDTLQAVDASVDVTVASQGDTHQEQIKPETAAVGGSEQADLPMELEQVTEVLTKEELVKIQTRSHSEDDETVKDVPVVETLTAEAQEKQRKGLKVEKSNQPLEDLANDLMERGAQNQSPMEVQQIEEQTVIADKKPTKQEKVEEAIPVRSEKVEETVSVKAEKAERVENKDELAKVKVESVEGVAREKIAEQVDRTNIMEGQPEVKKRVLTMTEEAKPAEPAKRIEVPRIRTRRSRRSKA